jgi:catechol 2,3-dioxygenase-like lactoylglutathione lyase family enzyme
MAAIHHVSLELAPAQLDAARQFWALLGFAETPAPAGVEGRAVWLAGGRLGGSEASGSEASGSGASGGGSQIHLLLDSPDPTAPPRGHVALVVGDAYEAVLRELRQAGYPIEPRAAHWGSPRCYVMAPGGHRVELMRSEA